MMLVLSNISTEVGLCRRSPAKENRAAFFTNIRALLAPDKPQQRRLRMILGSRQALSDDEGGERVSLD